MITHVYELNSHMHEVNLMQLNVAKFVSYTLQVGSFFCVLLFLPIIKSIAMIWLK